MKQRTLAAIGIAGTAFLMALLAWAIYQYTLNPDSTAALVGMGALSTGLMTFLVIFGVFYIKPPSDKDRYMELYGNTCANCGAQFDESGVCPKCGRVRPPRD